MKQRKVLMRAIPALVACMASGYAAASGFQLLEQNASGIGNAYAGSAAVAENASTVFYNPAGMTQLEGKNVSAGLAVIQTSYKFNNNGSSVGFLGAAGDGNDGGATGYVPNGYFTMPITKDLYFGLGIGAPFGLKTEYDSPWMGGAQSLKFDIKTMNINPSIAWRVNETVSLGFGLDWQKINAQYKRLAAVSTAALGSITSTMNISDDAWGWNAGILFNVSPSTKVGISYRSAIKYSVTGDVSLAGNAAVAGSVATATALSNAGAASNVQADLKLPDTWIFSATQKLNEQWEMLGDLSWTGWSSIPKIDINRTSGPLSLSATTRVAQTLDTDFRDTWRAALGANYKYSDTIKLKFGLAYDQTPVKGEATRLVSLPDNNRTWLSFGVQWQPSKGTAVDVGATRLFVKDPSINNVQTNADPTKNRGIVKGTYSDSAWILGAQYSVSF